MLQIDQIINNKHHKRIKFKVEKAEKFEYEWKVTLTPVYVPSPKSKLRTRSRLSKSMWKNKIVKP